MKKTISFLLSVVMILSCCFGVDLSALASDLYEIHISGTYQYDYANEVLEIVNEERAAEGLSELTMDAELLDAAMLRASECAVSFNHTRPDGSSCFTLCSKISGENIAAGRYGSSTTPETVMESWMESAAHKSNILGSSYQSIGIGCFYNNGVYYWVQCFSRAEADSISSESGYVSVTNVVTVDSDIIDLYASFSSVTFSPTETRQLKYGIVNYGWNSVCCLGNSEDFIFASSDENIVQVDSDGYCTAVNEGTATVTVYLKADTDIYYSVKITVACKDISNYTVTIPGKNYIYTAKAVTPEVSISGLTENTDYILNYSNNVDIGTATITITGIGRYKGTQEINFNIVARTLSVSGLDGKYEYTGTEITPKPKVYSGSTLLTEDVDYTLSYSNNVDIGTATITVTGLGIYKGTSEINFEIYKKKTYFSISLIGKNYYTGSEVTPKPTVYFNGVKLTENVDYTLSYSNNIDVGKAKITVTGIGEYEDVENSTIYFTILAQSASSNTSTSTSTTKPKKTAIKKLTKKSKAFKVTWTKKSNVTGYQVQYATNKKFTKNKKTVTVKGASKTSKTVKGLKSKKTYYVRVRTYKIVNGKKVYSNWSAVKKVTTK